MRRLAGTALACALVLAACSGGGLETPAETLRRTPEAPPTSGWVLDAAPEGYELCSLGTASALSLTSESEASLHMYGDGDLDDPYAGSLYGVATFPAVGLVELPLGATEDVTVEVDVGDGPRPRPARLGRIDGLLVAELPAAAGSLVTFSAPDDRIVQLAVRGDDDVDLVELAEAVVVTDGTATLDLAALPAGFVSLGDRYELESRTRFRFSLDYQLRDDAGALEDQVTLLGAAGDAASMNAFRFGAATAVAVDVAGWPGVVADIGSTGDGPHVVSWLVDDELILRVFSFRLGPDRLVELARGAREVTGAEWAELVEAFDPATCEF